MAEPARVGSIEALASFRASLIVALSKARPCLEEIGETARRTRDWIQNDRQSHWQHQARRRKRELEQAQQELFSAKFSQFQGPATDKQWAVTRAQHALSEAEEKLRLIKKWNRDFSLLTDPHLKQIDQARSFLSQEMTRAVASLAETITLLESYLQVAPPKAGASPASPAVSAPAVAEETESVTAPAQPPDPVSADESPLSRIAPEPMDRPAAAEGSHGNLEEAGPDQPRLNSSQEDLP